MEERKCEGSLLNVEKDIPAPISNFDCQLKPSSLLDERTANRVNGNHNQYSLNVTKGSIEKTKNSNESISNGKFDMPTSAGVKDNNGLVEYEERCKIIIKKEIMDDEETVKSGESFSEEQLVIKQEKCDSEEWQNDSVEPDNINEICKCCTEIKRENGKNTLDFLVYNKVTSLKRNRSSQDLPSDGIDEERKTCKRCGKNKFRSYSHERPASPLINEGAGRPRSESSVSDSSDMSLRSGRNLRKKHKGEFETDPVVLARRQKQINYGKNTTGYKIYQEQVPKYQRSRQDPATPPKHVKYSRRGWDGLIKAWRRRLHNWDPPRLDVLNIGNDSVLSESPVPTVSDDSEGLMDFQIDSDHKEFSWSEDVEREEVLQDE